MLWWIFGLWAFARIFAFLSCCECSCCHSHSKISWYFQFSRLEGSQRNCTFFWLGVGCFAFNTFHVELVLVHAWGTMKEYIKNILCYWRRNSILACQKGATMSMSWAKIGFLSIHVRTPSLSMHNLLKVMHLLSRTYGRELVCYDFQLGVVHRKRFLILYAKEPMGNHRAPTLEGKSHWVKGLQIFFPIIIRSLMRY